MRLRFQIVRVKCKVKESGGKITIGVQNRGKSTIAPNFIIPHLSRGQVDAALQDMMRFNNW